MRETGQKEGEKADSIFSKGRDIYVYSVCCLDLEDWLRLDAEMLDGGFSIDVWFLRRRRETRLGGIYIYRLFCKWLMNLVIGQELVDFGAVVASWWWWLI